MGDIVKCTGAILIGGTGEESIRSISIDTRSLKKGEMFVALKGERFDAHKFLKQALSKGASVLLIEKGRTIESRIPVIMVEDSLRAFGDIAHFWRQRIDPVVVAISGSNGKTTVKDMIGSVLSTYCPACVTEGNLNNLVGLPLTLFRLEKQHEVAVVELGMNMRGELRRLTEVANPDIAVLTNVGESHIGKFGSEEALLSAKGELFEGLSSDGAAIINRDCERSTLLLEALDKGQRIVGFGIEKPVEVRAVNIRRNIPIGYEFTLELRERKTNVRMGLFGRHNIYNALCAACTLDLLGVPLDHISHGLSHFTARSMRSEIEMVGGILFVKDYYNANPTSMVAAARSLFDIDRTGNRYVILGDMGELGDFSVALHQRVGRDLSGMGLDGIFTIGKLGRIMHESLYGTVSRIHFDTQDEAVREIVKVLVPGDVALIKASRMMKFEYLFDRLKHNIGDRISPE